MEYAELMNVSASETPNRRTLRETQSLIGFGLTERRVIDHGRRTTSGCR